MTAGPEVAWFGALCDDDVEQLGVPAPHLLSSFEHCRDIVLAARDQGFDNILLPSGYQLGIDTLVFAARGGARGAGPHAPAHRGPLRRDVAAAAGPPAGDAGPDAGRRA